MSYIKSLLLKACEQCENGNFNSCEDRLACPVYALYVEASKKNKTVYKRDDWQVPPPPKSDII